MHTSTLVGLVLLPVLAVAQPPPCTPALTSLLVEAPPGAPSRLLKCDGQAWVPWDASQLCSAPAPTSLAPASATPEPVRPDPAALEACRSKCTVAQRSCFQTQCGAFQTATCKQRCAKTLAICNSGCLPKAPEPERAATPTPVPVQPVTPALAVQPGAQPAPVSPAPAAERRPTAMESLGTALDVVNTGLGVVNAVTGGPAAGAPPSREAGASAGTSRSGLSASATCCLNGVGYTCPSAAAVDRCSGAFMRCMMSGKSDSVCLRESPPDPSSCTRDASVSCSR